MKKIDLHIHTIATVSDSSFVFSIDKLKDYVKSLKIDSIAITNHNTFNLVQYREISTSCECYTFPGIEIDLENGHLLLISDNNELEDFTIKCNEISKLITTKEDSISYESFIKIFPDLSKYMVIPHYAKSPTIKDEIIKRILPHCTAGEVNSPKKFVYCCKDKSSLVPVLFSDIRASESLSTYPPRQTFIDLDSISFTGIKTCLNDKGKVFLSEKDCHDYFQALPNGLRLSTGLNIILGERSSGKSYTLDRINESFENVKYIKQFSLLERDEEADIRNFQNSINERQGIETVNYLEEFRNMVFDIEKIDLQLNERLLDKYIETLLCNASEIEKADTFSKAVLFNESEYPESNFKNLESLISSSKAIFENTEYRHVIQKYIDINNLKSLIIELINEYQKSYEINLKMRWVNSIVFTIKESLKMHTSSTVIEDIDFYKIAFERFKVTKFEKITKIMQSDKEITRNSIHSFSIVSNRKVFNSPSELKSISHSRNTAFTNAFAVYGKPYAFLMELKKIDGIDSSDYYKYFVKIEYKILNKHGFDVSGGERSEFNLLQEISDAQKFDMLMIDEPESSFDNLFLKNEVNELIKDISLKTPVVIVTHNNTVGASIKPNYLIYTHKSVLSSRIEYEIYSGLPSDKKLVDLYGKEMNNFTIMLNCLEAGKEAYKEREHSYEILEN